MDNELTVLVPVAAGTVAFYHDTLEVALVDTDGQARTYAALRPICEQLGLDWSSQLKRIQRSTVLSEALATVVVTAADGRSRQALCLPDEMIHGFLIGISEERVHASLRPALIRYQRECYAALHAHFTGQAAASALPALPSGDAPALALLQAQINEVQAQLAQIRRAQPKPTAADPALHPAAIAILAVVAAQSAPTTPWAVARVLQAAGHAYDHIYVRVRMGRLARAGHLIKVAHGQYIAADAAESEQA